MSYSKLLLNNDFKEYPLTNLQSAYWLAKNEDFQLGGFSTHGYLEIHAKVDIQKFESCWQQLIDRHPMLRAVISNEGKQVILSEADHYSIEVSDLSKEKNEIKESAILKRRREMSHHDFDLSNWPLFGIKAFQLSEHDYLIGINWDMIVLDGSSMRQLGEELWEIYNDSNDLVPLNADFGTYINYLNNNKQTKEYKKAESFWMSKLEDFPSFPRLPMKKSVNLDEVKKMKFSTLSHRFNEHEWNAIQLKSSQQKATPSAFLCTVFSKLLAYWSNQPRFMLNLTTFNKPFSEKDLENVLGDFTTLSILDVDFRNTSSFSEEVREVQKKMFETLRYRQYDGVEFLRNLGKRNERYGELLAPVVFTSLINNESSKGWEQLGSIDYEIYETPQVFLDCVLIKQKEGIKITWNYATEILDLSIVQNMFEQFIEMIGNSITEQEGPLFQEQSISDLYDQYNDTGVIYPVHTLYSLFADQAKKTPLNIAVKSSASTLTYEELDLESNKIANYILHQLGPGGGNIAVEANRNTTSIINVLGILKAGYAYVPIEKNYPDARKEYILNKSECKMYLDEITNKESSFFSNESLDYKANPESLAYIIYTSGSTGEPKGVSITNASAVNTIQDVVEKFGVTSADRILAISSLCFDLSVFDIFGSLSCGASLHLLADQRDMQEVYAIVKQEKITIWNSVPALFELFINEFEEKDLNSIKTVMLSGDFVSKKLIEKVAGLLEESNVYALGGATEASIWSNYYPAAQFSYESLNVPYGFPLGNQKLLVLNHQQQLCPVDVEGELYIGGVGVAQGYYNDLDKTEMAFVEHPFHGRLYKTGDYAKMKPKSYIEFIGRKDHQVKVNGHRVELEEISNELIKLKFVRNALTLKKFVKGAQAIVSYIQLFDEEIHFDWTEHLKSKLPAYMIPKYFVTVKEFSLSPNGKIDLKKLPDPEVKEEQAEYKKGEFTNPLEARIGDIFKEILSVSHVEADDDFFALGGDSVLAIQLVSKIRNEKMALSIGDVFDKRTIRAIAKQVEKSKTKRKATKKIKPTMELTPIQEWFFETQKDDLHHWNQSIHVELAEETKVSLLREAIHKALSHHDVLYSSFHKENDKWIQKFHSVREFPFEMRTVPTSPHKTEKQQIDQIVLEEQSKLNLENGDLFRVIFIDSATKGKSLLMISHHLIIDAFSWRIIFRDVNDYYENQIEEQSYDETSSYQIWAEELYKYAQKEKYRSNEHYWISTFDELNYLRPEKKSSDEDIELYTKEVHLQLSPEETESMLKSASENHNIGMREFILLASMIGLHEVFKEEKYSFNLESHGREELFEDVDLSRSVGWFTSMYPINLKYSNKVSYADNLNNIKESINSIPLGGIEFGIMKYLSQEFDRQTISDQKLVGFNYLGRFDNVFNQDSIFKRTLMFNESNFSSKAKRPNLIDIVAIVENGLKITLFYNENQFERITMQKIADVIKRELTSLSERNLYLSAKLSEQSLNKIFSNLLGGKKNDRK